MKRITLAATLAFVAFGPGIDASGVPHLASPAQAQLSGTEPKGVPPSGAFDPRIVRLYECGGLRDCRVACGGQGVRYEGVGILRAEIIEYAGGASLYGVFERAGGIRETVLIRGAGGCALGELRLLESRGPTAGGAAGATFRRM